MRRSRCDVVHVDLYFFFDVDVVLLNVEVARRRPAAGAGAGAAVPLRPRLPGRLGRAGPRAALPGRASSGWAPTARCWRAPTRSSATPSSPMSAEHRAPRIAAHWAFLLEPLVADHSDARRRAALPPDRVLPHADDGLPGAGRSARADARRLHPPRPGHRRRRRADAALPYAEQHLADFEQRYCYDRFWADARRGAEHALPVQRPCAGRGRRRAGRSSTAAATAACWRSSATSISCCS